MKSALKLIPPSLSTLAIVAVITVPAAAQQVLKVNGLGTGGAFTQIQPAIDAATGSDLILVANGTYSGFDVDGKSLRIFANSGANPKVDGQWTIRNIQADQSVELHGLEFPGSTSQTTNLSIRDCEGPILIQDCEINLPSSFAGSAFHGVEIYDSESITFVNTTVDGINARKAPTGFVPYAVLTENSNSYFYGCTLWGASGAIDLDDEYFLSQSDLQGAPALYVKGGSALIVKCTMTGGAGSDSFANTGGVTSGPSCDPPGDGGPAVQLVAGLLDPVVKRVTSALIGGPGGASSSTSIFGSTFTCAGGDPSPIGVLVDAGTFSTVFKPSRTYSTEPVTRPGEVKSNTLVGNSGELTWILYSTSPGLNEFLPTVADPIFPGSPGFLLFTGTTNFAGLVTKSVTVGDFGLDYLPLYEQAFFYNPTFGFIASNPRMAVLVDD